MQIRTNNSQLMNNLLSFEVFYNFLKLVNKDLQYCSLRNIMLCQLAPTVVTSYPSIGASCHKKITN